METTGIVAYREKLEQVVGKYHDFLGDEAESLCQEHSVPTARDLQAQMASIEDEERLLKIGIVGRVKSGKSSLLNALVFDGQSILPEAATPMTASLTTLSYGEPLSAEVEFFTQEDLADIRGKAEEYDRQLERRVREIRNKEKTRKSLFSRRSRQENKSRSRRNSDERVQRRAEREMRENIVLSSARDQYKKMTESGVSLENLPVLLKFGNLADLGSQLNEYVGAKGQYMPFTKSVNIRLPQENLKDIEIVDTPGINDPVQSREARTQEHLNQCDVVLVIIVSGQFINNVDLELMDRITSKEGIRELFVVASKADDVLFSHFKAENNGQLDLVLDSFIRVLGNQLEKVIADLKESSPEVGDTYDQLLEGQSKVIHSAGLCESLKQRFRQKDEWSKVMQHVWNNLQTGYPDYFSDADENLSRFNLEKLSNISTIRNIVEQVREKKQEILDKRMANYVHAKYQSLHALRKGLLAYANERQSQIESTDIAKFKEQRRGLTKALDDASEEIKDEYEESIYLIKKSMRDKFKQGLEAREQALKRRIENEKGEDTETYKDGLIFKTTRTRTFATIRTNAVHRRLSEFSEELKEEVVDKTEDEKRDWRNDLNRNMTKILRKHFGDEDLEASLIRRVIRDTVHSINIPAFEYKKQIPDSLNPQGVLKDEEAKKFFDESRDYVDDLCRGTQKEISAYIKELAKRMEQGHLYERLLEQFQKELASLEKSIENKEMELKRISNLRGELERVEVNE